MKNQLKGFLTITQNGVKMSVNPQLIETFQPYQTHDNSEIDKTLIVTSSGQTFIVDNKDFDPEGYKAREEAKEKARREQEKKDLEEILKNASPPLSEEDKADMIKKAGELGTQATKNRADKVAKTLKTQK